MACALSRRARHRRIWVELKDNSSLGRGPASHTVFPNPGVFKLQPHKRLTGRVVLTTVKMCFDSRGYNRTPHRNGSFLVESWDRNPTDKMGEGAAHCGTLTSQGRAVVRCGAGLYNTGLVLILPPSRRYKRRLPSDTAKCPVPGQNGPPASYNTDPSMEKHLRKQAC